MTQLGVFVYLLRDLCLPNYQGHIKGGDGDRIYEVDGNHAPTHLPRTSGSG